MRKNPAGCRCKVAGHSPAAASGYCAGWQTPTRGPAGTHRGCSLSPALYMMTKGLLQSVLHSSTSLWSVTYAKSMSAHGRRQRTENEPSSSNNHNSQRSPGSTHCLQRCKVRGTQNEFSTHIPLSHRPPRAATCHAAYPPLRCASATWVNVLNSSPFSSSRYASTSTSATRRRGQREDQLTLGQS